MFEHNGKFYDMHYIKTIQVNKKRYQVWIHHTGRYSINGRLYMSIDSFKKSMKGKK